VVFFGTAEAVPLNEADRAFARLFEFMRLSRMNGATGLIESDETPSESILGPGCLLRSLLQEESVGCLQLGRTARCHTIDRNLVIVSLKGEKIFELLEEFDGIITIHSSIYKEAV
jgi:hypothetical protein